MNVRSIVPSNNISDNYSDNHSDQAGNPVPAATLWVPSQYATIQAGIEAAKNGDTVLVADGFYFGAGNTALSLHGKSITIRSASDDPTKCILYCQNNGVGFVAHGSETAPAVIRGFTITGGWADQRGGGARLSASPQIIRCIFDHHTSLYVGGGLSASNDYPTPTHTAFLSASTEVYYDGAGI